jgi:hypothetical protein
VTLIPAANRVDMVHDAQRGFVYVTNGPNLLVYQTSTGTLAPLFIGGDLGGIDLSPDGSTLVIADRTGSAIDSGVFLVALNTLAATRVAVSKSSSMEGGMFTAAYGADNAIYTTSMFNGSGTVPLRKLDPATGTWTTLATINQDTMLAPSGDAQTIAFAESNTSDGAWGLIDIPTGQIVRRTGYTNGTSWFNFEIAADRLGTQFSIPTYDGTFVYNDTYQKIATLGQYAGQLPIGVAYHPVDQIAYFPWSGTSQVRVYDMNTLTQTGAYDFGSAFSWVGNHAFQQGRTRLSRDGSLLMVTIDGGVGLQTQYAPLAADTGSVSTNAGQTVWVTLGGRIGNNDALTYEIIGAPSHGTATLANFAQATYTPAAGFYGNDAFAYRVHYGRAFADSQVSITVIKPNTPPVAVNDRATAVKSPILIPVLANDSDADGNPLTIVSVTQPARGSASIQSNQILFTPGNGFNGTVTFNYTISDGRGGSASATVTVSKGK